MAEGEELREEWESGGGGEWGEWERGRVGEWESGRVGEGRLEVCSKQQAI
jgi:hypothetical protein